jgi:hypothetical protein
MKQIEDTFQDLACRIVAGSLTSVDIHQKAVVDAFFALWRARAEYRVREDGEVSLNGVTGEELTKVDEERLEKSGVAFARVGGKLPRRVEYGLRIQKQIDMHVDALAGVQWGVIRAEDGHFVVPDRPAHLFVPLSPTMYLNGDGRSGIVTEQSLAEFNGILRSTSMEYYFALDLGRCP